MNRTITRIFSTAGAIFMVVATASGCGTADEPVALADNEQQQIVALLEAQGTGFESPSCQVEVFRTQENTTYGWSTCTETTTEEAQPTGQAESFPFKIVDEKVQRPDDGEHYLRDVQKIFPEDLWGAIKQHSLTY